MNRGVNTWGVALPGCQRRVRVFRAGLGIGTRGREWDGFLTPGSTCSASASLLQEGFGRGPAEG